MNGWIYMYNQIKLKMWNKAKINYLIYIWYHVVCSDRGPTPNSSCLRCVNMYGLVRRINMHGFNYVGNDINMSAEVRTKVCLNCRSLAKFTIVVTNNKIVHLRIKQIRLY